MKTITESKIEKTIDEIREYVDTCKTVPLMPGKIMVNKDEFDELLDELESTVPDEVKQSREIVAKYDEIISEAENQARRKMDDAGQEINKMLSENEILLQAYAHADEVVAQARETAQAIIDKAMLDANDVKDATNGYIDGMLQNLENLISATMQTNEKKYQDMQNNLENYYQIVLSNRQEINGGSGDGDVMSPVSTATGEINIDMM